MRRPLRVHRGSAVRVLQPVVVFGLASVCTLTALTLHGALAADSEPVVAPLDTVGPTHGLDDLSVLQTVLFQVEESYVEPTRVDWEEMYVAALQAVEHAIPVCLFRREGRVLHVEVGRHRAVTEVPRIGSRKALQDALEDVATRIGVHIRTQDIPGRWDDPYIRIEYVMVNGALSTLDPHSTLLVPEEAREMDVDNDGDYGGIGVTVDEIDGRLVIARVRPGDPADRAGLVAGDHISRVHGASTMGVDMADALYDIRGMPGTDVLLEVRTPGQVPRDVTVTRGVIVPEDVVGEWLGDGVLYLAIPTFHDDVHTGLRRELSRAAKAHGALKGVVLDLRGNPGGYLLQAVAVSNAFLSGGTILSTVGVGNLREPPQRAFKRDTEPDYPLAVLVDADSASASEIVAGALRNNERAVIIGERSFGKGSVQNLWDLPDGSKLKLTVGKYLTPGEISIQAVGIPADIETVPVVVDLGDGVPDIRITWREGVLRESDLDHRFDGVQASAADPAYSLRYLRAAATARRADGRLDPMADAQVLLAKEVLIGARSARRSDILAGVAQLVERTHVLSERGIIDALDSVDVDWRDGPGVTDAHLQTTMRIADGRVLQAGETAQVTVSITNAGDAPIRRVLGVSASESYELDGLEWVFGRIDAGETRSATRVVRLPAGYGTAEVGLELSIRDAASVVAREHIALTVAAQARPSLAWSWTATDLGDGDGIPEPGESWAADVTLSNVGDGPTRQPFVRLSASPSAGIEMSLPIVHPGTPQQADGSACEVKTNGWDGETWVGDVAPSGAPGFDPVAYMPGCQHVISAGQRVQARLLFTVSEAPRQDVPLVLTVGDAGIYDVGAVSEAGFIDTYANRDTLWLSLSGRQTVRSARPPSVVATTPPPSRTQAPTVTVSGLASDDDGIAHVVVYADDDKVFLDVSDPESAAPTVVPYTATVRMKPGAHRLVVIATDVNGHARTETYRVLAQAPVAVGQRR